jgi:hypothetical protein
MTRKMTFRLTALALTLATAGAVAVYATAAKQASTPSHVFKRANGSTWSTAASAGLPPGLVRAMNLVPDKVQRLGAFTNAAGRAQSVYVAEQTNGRVCLIESSSGGFTPDGRPIEQISGGCDRSLYLGHAFAWRAGSDGGPSAAQMNGYHIIGIAKPEVARLVVVDSAGGQSVVHLRAGGAFLYEASRASLRAGVRPTELVAYGADGAALDRMAVQ